MESEQAPSSETMGSPEISKQENDKSFCEDNKLADEKSPCSMEEVEDDEPKAELKIMQPCWPAICNEKCTCCNSVKSTFLAELFLALRTLMFKVVNNRVFDGSVLFVILLSTMTLVSINILKICFYYNAILQHSSIRGHQDITMPCSCLDLKLLYA